MDRRRLIKWVIVVAVAVVVLVEGLTLLGLVSSHFAGGDPARTPTPGEPAVGVGDELLAETPQRETLRAATIDGGERWTLTLTVAIDNTGDAPYALSLGDVRAGGRRIEGSSTSGRIEPGGSGSVTGRWTLPSGTLPDAVSVRAVQYDGEGGVEGTIQREVRLASIPVRG